MADPLSGTHMCYVNFPTDGVQEFETDGPPNPPHFADVQLGEQ
jgi:hypothetical protein